MEKEIIARAVAVAAAAGIPTAAEDWVSQGRWAYALGVREVEDIGDDGYRVWVPAVDDDGRLFWALAPS